MKVFIDFETRSVLDLKKVGLTNYIRHPSTKVICMAYTVDNDPRIQSISFPIKINKFFRDLPADVIFVAHNAGFEKSVIEYVIGIKTNINQWIDTAAIGRYYNIAGSLKLMGAFLGLEKMESGTRLINALCKESDKTPLRKDRPDLYDELEAYCKRDVEICRLIYSIFGDIPKVEKLIYATTYQMNANGIPFDYTLVQQGVEMISNCLQLNNIKMQELAGCSVNQVGKIAEKIGVKSINAANIRQLLADPNIDQQKREILQLRQESSLTSIKKYHKIQSFIASEKYIHESFIYYGASQTGRWSGVGIQPQNIPRGYSGDKLIDKLEAIRSKSKDVSLLDLSNCLRGLILADQSKLFFIGDFSQVEARILATIACQNDLKNNFAAGVDSYRIMASKIFRIEPKEVTAQQRFLGKQLILACGYSMGAAKFKDLLLNTYNVYISDVESSKLVQKYRKENQKIVLFWTQLESKIAKAIKTESIQELQGLKIGVSCKKEYRYLYIKLWSGRKLYYWNPQIVTGKIITDVILSNGKAAKKALWGGSFTGHICQAISRDYTASALLRLSRAGWQIIMLVHDEIVAHDLASKDLDSFKQLFLQIPAWDRGVPIAGEFNNCKDIKNIMKESKIQTQIIKYFQLKGFIVIVHVGKIGFPDLLILEGQGMHFWVEVKTETGVLSEVQKKTIDKLRATGDRVYVCRSEHDARKII